MNTPLIRVLRHRDWLRLAYETSCGLAVCAASATAGFLADRGPGRGLDPSHPVQIAAAAAWVILSITGLTLNRVVARRRMIAQAREQAARAEVATLTSVGRRAGSSAQLPPPSSAPTTGSTSALPTTASTAARAG